MVRDSLIPVVRTESPSKRLFSMFGITIAIGLSFIVSPVMAQPEPDEPAAAAIADGSEASPLLSEPTTPDALFDAVVLMIDLARPRLARAYLQRLLSAKPDDAALLAMRDKHGPAVFLRMANLESLQPGSVTLLNRMTAAFTRFAGDEKRIDRLIDELRGAPSVRDAAILQLRSGGALVVPRLIETIGDVKDEAPRELLTYTLARLGPEVIPPLLAALDSPDTNLQTIVLEVLGRVGSRKTAVHLWYFAVDKNKPPGVRVSAAEAVARLTLGNSRHASSLSQQMALKSMELGARNRLAGREMLLAGPNGKVTSWYFDPMTMTVKRTDADPKDVALHAGCRIAQQALVLSPESKRLQALLVSLLLARARNVTPWTESLPRGVGTAYDAAILSGGSVVTESLRDALRTGNATTAAGALEVLRTLAKRNDLKSKTRRGSALASALNYPDPRVQFAAAMAIVETDPTESFRGASRIVQVLSRTLESTDQPVAILAGPKPAQVNALAGLVDQSGYRAHISSNGRDLFREASSRGDVQLVVVDANVIQWSLSQTIANLRADSRTAWLPIIVVGDPAMISTVTRMIQRDPLLTYIQRPGNLEGLKVQLERFVSGVKSKPLSAAERGEMARAAIDLLGYLGEGRRSKVFDLRPAEAGLHSAIQNPDLADGAIFALAAIPTASAQDRLATTALQPGLKAGPRERAAAQLAFHIQKHGVLLNRSRIEETQNAHVDERNPEVKSALAGVLGAMSPTPAKVGQQLRSFEIPGPR